MNSSTANIEKKSKLPLWLIILIISVSLITASYLGLHYYQQFLTGAEPSRLAQLERSQLEDLKEKIIQQPDTIDTNWLRTLNPIVKQVQGRLLWSSSMQQGVVEFINLPLLRNDQQYRLWVYDLEANNSKPVSAAVFKKAESVSGIFSRAFKPKTKVKNPLRFELVLEQGGVEGYQPLLLAQP